MEVRAYEGADLPDVQRIWQECGWVDEDDAVHLEDFLADAHAVVAVADSGDVEACASIHDGSFHHGGIELPLAAVTSVTTGRAGRRQGLAGAALQRALHDAVDRGAAVSALGMFEQGYYDLFGFGTGSEMLLLRVDPAHLRADLPYRPPSRLTLDDMPDITAALVARRKPHGAVVLPSVAQRRAERSWDDDGFGLGYRDEDGTLTHFVWCSVKDEAGPYEVREWAWRSTHELLELLGALRSLSDQVRTILVPEPSDLQFSVLVDRPNRMKITRTTGPHRHEMRASAWWQARILDLPTCIAALSTPVPLHCNLHVRDPLAAHGIEGTAGEWVLTLGETSFADRGHEEDLPTLTASVNAFTRLWLGVRPASVLAATDDLTASPDLLAGLDAAIRLPRPDVQMDF